MDKKYDWLVAGAAAVLFCAGLLVIIRTPGGFFGRQLVWFAFALAGFFTFFFVPQKVLYVSAWPLYGAAVLLLVLVLFVAERSPRRWFDFGVFNIQPSEFARLAVVFALARHLSKKSTLEFRFRDLTAPVAIVFVPALCVAMEPDLGSLGAFFIVLGVVLYWHGLGPFPIFLLFSPLLSLFLAFSFIAWAVYFILLVALILWRAGFIPTLAVGFANALAGLFTPIIWNQLAAYQKARIIGFFAPWLDPQGVGWHLVQSTVTIGSGRLWGKGLFAASQHRLGFLPNAHTDFVFASLGETFGFLGCLAVLGLFAVLIYRYFSVGRDARSPFAGLLAAGFGALLAYSVVVNVGVVVGVLPITGIPLPFVSYGGSSLVVTCAQAGIILNLARHRFE